MRHCFTVGKYTYMFFFELHSHVTIEKRVGLDFLLAREKM